MPTRTDDGHLRRVTVRAAADAIGVHHDTLKKRLLAAGREVRASSRFTIKQVFQAMLLDPSQARARESDERSKKLKLERETLEGRLWAPEKVDDAIRSVLLPMRQKVLAVDSECAPLCSDPDRALEVLHAWKLNALETVFAKKDDPKGKSI